MGDFLIDLGASVAHRRAIGGRRIHMYNDPA
jgi:hypothetical protein